MYSSFSETVFVDDSGRPLQLRMLESIWGFWFPLGLYGGYIGIMEENMEIAIKGLGFQAQLFRKPCAFHSFDWPEATAGAGAGQLQCDI